MLDLGDLREGWFDDDGLFEAALMVERSMPSLYLRGVGTNLGCYGSVLPGAINLGRLVALARRIEAAIGRPLEVVSGGATSDLPMLAREGLPPGITELRIGEGALCARDLPHYYKVELPGVRSDAFTLRAEVIEARRKPSHPVGERFIDAFGNKPVYEDRGVRTRLLLGIGKRDFGSHDHLLPRDPRVHVIGSSSDHLICEADESSGDIAYGSILEFDLMYGAMLFLCDGNPYIGIDYL
jgi:predicted amino acid racemase